MPEPSLHEPCVGSTAMPRNERLPRHSCRDVGSGTGGARRGVMRAKGFTACIAARMSLSHTLFRSVRSGSQGRGVQAEARLRTVGRWPGSHRQTQMRSVLSIAPGERMHANILIRCTRMRN